MGKRSERCRRGLRVATAILVLCFSGCEEALQTAAGDNPETVPRWHRHAENPIIVPGFPVKPGGPAAVNVADASVLYDEEEKKWKMWFAVGWQEGKVARLNIKYAESPDGVGWTIRLAPALEPSPNAGDWDHTQVETPSVVKNPSAPRDKRYMMWYSGGNTVQRQIKGFPYYQIGLAFSADGREFTRLPAADSPQGKAGLVFTAHSAFPGEPKVRDGVVADPAVVMKDGAFHMWFSSIGLDRRGRGVTAGIGYATSADGIRWGPNRKNPLQSLWGDNPGGPAQPSVLWNGGKGEFEMWFTNDKEEELRRVPAREHATVGYWHASSRNGEDWTIRGRDFKWDRRSPAEEFGLVTGVEVVLREGEYRMYYGGFGSRKVPTGWDGPAVWALNLATRKER